MTNPVRFALIGLGQPHMEAYTETLLNMPGVEIVAAYDWEMHARPQTLPESLAGMPIYKDVEPLLDEIAPDALMVCLPGKFVPGIVELAAARGIHVMAEKPCAISADAWLPATRAIEASGIQFATGYLRKFHPVYKTMRQLVEEGIVGDLLAAARIIEDAHFRDFTFKGLRRIETAAFRILFLTEGDSAAGFQIANVDIGFKGRLAVHIDLEFV